LAVRGGERGFADHLRGARPLERALIDDEDLRRELDLDPQEEALALRDPGFRAASPSARLDGFIGEDASFASSNTTPSRLREWRTTTSSRSLRIAAGDEEISRGVRMSVVPTRGRQLTAMLRAHRSRSEDAPAIAIVDWRGLPTLTEFEMFERYFESRGIPTVICAPDDLTYSRGTLRARGKPINLVYRRVSRASFLRRATFPAPRPRVPRRSRDRGQQLPAKLLHKKMSLALLSDDRYAALYTAPQRAAIAKHIPWTRKVREDTRRTRQVVDLGDFVIAHRERLVLKPNDEYGGKGVVLGWTIDQHEWSSLPRRAGKLVCRAGAVSVPRYPSPSSSAACISSTLDRSRSYLFWGRVSGTLARFHRARC